MAGRGGQQYHVGRNAPATCSRSLMDKADIVRYSLNFSFPSMHAKMMRARSTILASCVRLLG